MSYSRIQLEMSGPVARIILSSPANMNALAPALVDELRTAVAQVNADPAMRALILTGSGRAFSAGADLTAMSEALDRGEDMGQVAANEVREFGNPLARDLRASRVPVIAAVNGVAAGAGASLALATDIVVAARSAFFLFPFLPKLGLLPDVGATWQLQRRLGRSRALGVALLGDRLPAEQAAEWGLIWAAVDDEALSEEVEKLAARLAAMPQDAIRELRQALDAAAGNELEEQLEYEAQRQIELAGREEFQEGVRAFLEKRAPRFP